MGTQGPGQCFRLWVPPQMKPVMAQQGPWANLGAGWVAVNVNATPILGRSKLWRWACLLLGGRMQPKLFHRSPPRPRERDSDGILLAFPPRSPEFGWMRKFQSCWGGWQGGMKGGAKLNWLRVGFLVLDVARGGCPTV